MSEIIYVPSSCQRQVGVREPRWIITRFALNWPWAEKRFAISWRGFFSVLLPTIFLELNLRQLSLPVFIPSRRVGSCVTGSFHLDEGACSSVINILLTLDLACHSIEAQQTENRVEWQLVRKSLALVIRTLTYCRFCCYSLSVTFNGEFTGTAFGL